MNVEISSETKKAAILEQRIDERFGRFLEDKRMESRHSLIRRFSFILNDLISKDEQEYLDNPAMPMNERLFFVEKLSRVNDRLGIHHKFLAQLKPLILEAARLKGRGPVTLLDLGAGGGGLLRAIHKWSKKAGIQVELAGVDLSEDFMRMTEHSLRSQGIPVRMMQQDASDLKSFGDGSVDIVISLYVAHHIRSAGRLARYFSEASRVAKYSTLIVDMDRRFIVPFVANIGGYLAGAPRELRLDGVRSARRSYRTSEIRFILGLLQESKDLGGNFMCNSGFLLPYWYAVFKRYLK